MKIITNNAVYVQNEDIYHLNEYLTETDLAIPASITMKVIDTDSSNRFACYI